MFWIKTLFKVSNSLEKRYELEINPILVKENIEIFKEFSNFSNLVPQIDRVQEILNNRESYDEKLKVMNNFVHLVRVNTIKNIKNKSFKIIKYDYFRKLFYILKKDMDGNFEHDEKTGGLNIIDSSKYLSNKQLLITDKKIENNEKNKNYYLTSFPITVLPEFEK